MASTPPSKNPPASGTNTAEEANLTHNSSATRVGPSFDEEPERPREKEEAPTGGFFQDAPGRDEESEGTTTHGNITSKSNQPQYIPDGKRIITEDECYHLLGYSWPAWKKWMLLSSIFAVQVSMNFNTSVFPSAVTPLSEHFAVSEQAVRAAQCAFLVLYAFGCELWAPWSEEFGRWKILQ